MVANIPEVPDYVDEQDYEYILNSYLANVRDDVDKREGSIIWDSGAPCCIEIAKAYLYLQAMIMNAFAATATSPYLEYRCAEQGIERHPATTAKRLGTFTDGNDDPYPIVIGTQFSTVGETNLVNFTVTEVFTSEGQTVPGSYILECTEPGTIGNEYFGEIVPIYNLSGLATATLSDILIPGEDEEDLEDLRARYFSVVNQKPFAGNIEHYREFTENIQGVGSCQIYPVWAGGGTVKISILDSNFNAPSSTLINTVQQAIDPHYNDDYAGKGIGQAPIGHVVTVVGASNFTVNVQCQIEMTTGLIVNQVRAGIEQNIRDYLLSLRKQWHQATDLNIYGLKVIRARVESAILNATGVTNVISCKLNNANLDITLQEDEILQQIPILGEVIING